MTLTLHPARKSGRVLTLLSLTGLCAAALPAQAGITTLASFTGASGAYPNAGVTFDSSGNLFGTATKGTSSYGTVYEIAKGSSTLTTLASFTGNGVGNNGSLPNAGVTFDSSGNLFGTTFSGGPSGLGTVYEIAKGSSTLTTLASFTGANGSGPYAGVTFDSSGNLFGTTFNGGTSSYGTVYEIAKGSSTLTTLASFTGSNGSAPYGGVTFDSSGNLFGTTSGGGTPGAGTVYEIAQGSSTLTTLASFTGVGTNGSTPFAGVTFDGSGNLFGTTYGGGTSGFGTLYEIAQGSSTLTTLASFTGANGGNPFAGVTFDGSGNLFGTTYRGGTSGAGTVYEIAQGSSTLTTLASFTGYGTGTNGGSPEAGVTFDSSGNLFGTTFSGGPSGLGTVYEIAGAGSPSAAPEPSQFAALGLTTLGVGGLLLRARKRRQNATPGV